MLFLAFINNPLANCRTSSANRILPFLRGFWTKLAGFWKREELAALPISRICVEPGSSSCFPALGWWPHWPVLQPDYQPSYWSACLGPRREGNGSVLIKSAETIKADASAEVSCPVNGTWGKPNYWNEFWTRGCIFSDQLCYLGRERIWAFQNR